MTQMSPLSLRPFRAAALAGSSLVALLTSLGACASDGIETRKQCNHHCSVEYETCSERSLGGNTLNNCGYENMRCNALCPSR
jgi:hypothetical protein